MAENVEDGNGDQPHRIKVRVEALSDIVFGLALSIGSLDFLSSAARDPFELATNLAYFGFSFTILVFTWLGYTRTMAVLPRATDTSLFINIGLLFLTAIEPYLFYVLVTSPTLDDANTASIVYALNVGGLFLLQAMLSRLVIIEDKKSKILKERSLAPEIISRFQGVLRAEVVIGVLYLISALPVFWGIRTPIGQARFIFWWSAFAVFFFRRRSRPSTKNTESEPELTDSVK